MPNAGPEFLQYFWDLAKPEHDARVKACAGILETLQKPDEDGEIMSYTLKRLVKGLASSRDCARQGFSFALSEVSVADCVSHWS